MQNACACHNCTDSSDGLAQVLGRLPVAFQPALEKNHQGAASGASISKYSWVGRREKVTKHETATGRWLATGKGLLKGDPEIL